MALVHDPDLLVLDETEQPRRAKVEAMAAHVNEQQCAQISIDLNVDAGDKGKQTSSNPPVNLHDNAPVREAAKME